MVIPEDFDFGPGRTVRLLRSFVLRRLAAQRIVDSLKAPLTHGQQAYAGFLIGSPDFDLSAVQVDLGPEAFLSDEMSRFGFAISSFFSSDFSESPRLKKRSSVRSSIPLPSSPMTIRISGWPVGPAACSTVMLQVRGGGVNRVADSFTDELQGIGEVGDDLPVRVGSIHRCGRRWHWSVPSIGGNSV